MFVSVRSQSYGRFISFLHRKLITRLGGFPLSVIHNGKTPFRVISNKQDNLFIFEETSKDPNVVPLSLCRLEALFFMLIVDAAINLV